MLQLHDNPLFPPDRLPAFARIRPEDAEAAINGLLARAAIVVDAVVAETTPPSFDNLVEPLSLALDQLNRAWGVVGHYLSIGDDETWRNVQHRLQPEVSLFFSRLGQNEALYRRYRSLEQSAAAKELSPARARILANECRDFRLAGVDLAEADKARLTELEQTLSRLATQFGEHLVDATKAYYAEIDDENELAGLPDEVVAAARASAAEMVGEPRPIARLSLQAPSYVPVMQWSQSPRLRETMYRAYTTRASELPQYGSKPEWDNGPIMVQMLQAKAERARLLGFSDHAAYSLERKMADSAATVLAFLRDLAARARPFAERERADLIAFAETELGLSPLNPWDIAFASERLRQKRYDCSQTEVKAYFPLSSVLPGLFTLIKRLFAVDFVAIAGEVWHPDVRLYELRRDTGEVVGHCYADLYARAGKQGGAWMNDLCGRSRSREGLRLPTALICCNFTPPTATATDSTLYHHEVETLFHEMGHALHHLLTEIDDLGVSGLNGVEWDAVELPSQFLENFAWDQRILTAMSAHIDSGEPLPDALFQRMLAARHFQSGMQLLRQIEFALFDMRLHAEGQSDVLAVLAEVRDEVAVWKLPSWNRFAHSFGHIFDGGYSAGYYSYLWAELLSADVFSAFAEANTAEWPRLGQKLLTTLLARGGEKPALDLFVAFRGRSPRIEPLLKDRGLLPGAVDVDVAVTAA